MITWNEVLSILFITIPVGFVFGILVCSKNWFKHPVFSILINNKPLVIYIRVLGVVICKVGEPNFMNNWNTFLFTIYSNFYVTLRWFIFGHKVDKMWLVKTESMIFIKKLVFGKKKITYIRNEGAKAFLIKIDNYSTLGDYFVAGSRTVKQRFKKTIHETGYLLIGECEGISGKCFVVAANEYSLRIKMTDIYINLYTLGVMAGKLNIMVAKATANMNQQTQKGRSIDA